MTLRIHTTPDIIMTAATPIILIPAGSVQSTRMNPGLMIEMIIDRCSRLKLR